MDTGKDRILTRREKEVLNLICRGFTNKEISVEMHISFAIARNHVASIMLKLEARNRAHVAAIGIKEGLVLLSRI